MARRDAGFTLVEVMVALMVMAIMATLAWRGVDGIVRTRNASQEHLERSLRLGTVIAQWERDLSSIQETTSVPAFGFDGATLRITRRAGDGMQVVAWALKPSAEGAGPGSTWLRWAGPTAKTNRALQESWLASQQLLGNEPGQLRTLTGLSQWQVYCYRNDAWTNCQSSGDVAAPAAGASAPAREALPTGIRLVLDFAPGSGNTGELTRDALVGQ